VSVLNLIHSKPGNSECRRKSYQLIFKEEDLCQLCLSLCFLEVLLIFQMVDKKLEQEEDGLGPYIFMTFRRIGQTWINVLQTNVIISLVVCENKNNTPHVWFLFISSAMTFPQ
jgi:hypothetical protein